MPETPPDAVRLDAHNLRGIAHPVRVRLLGLLRQEGPSTATKLAARLGLSSAATSYHLRQLAQYGFVTDDAEAKRSHGRERWWRAAHRSTLLDATPDEVEAAAAAEEYLRIVARRYSEKTFDWLDRWGTEPEGWRRAGTISDATLLLTSEEAVELDRRLTEVVDGYRRHEPGRRGPRGARPVVTQWQVLPEGGRR